MKAIFMLIGFSILSLSLSAMATDLPELHCQGSVSFQIKNPYIQAANVPSVPSPTPLIIQLEKMKDCSLSRTSNFAFMSKTCFETSVAEIKGQSEFIPNLKSVYNGDTQEYQIYIPRNLNEPSTSLRAKIQNQFHGFGTLKFRWGVSDAIIYAKLEINAKHKTLLLYDTSDRQQAAGSLSCQ